MWTIVEKEGESKEPTFQKKVKRAPERQAENQSRE